jgi:CheY-like chemotaxis protein
VLVADDDEDLRALVAGTLRRDGFAVLEFENGSGVLEYVDDLARSSNRHRAAPPDIVLLDVCMPRTGGLTTFEVLRATRYDIAIVFMTALGDDELDDRALEGASAVLHKPFDLARLRRLVLVEVANLRRREVHEWETTGDDLWSKAR